MNTKLLLSLAIVAAAFAPAARADIDIYADIRLGRAAPPPPPEVVVVEQVGPSTPPPWSRPGMFRRSYNYYYYPGADVYYRADNHTWFYLEGRTWRSARELPPGVRVDFGRSVSLKLDSDRPYIYHDRVVTYYPATYFARVRFKNDRDRRDWEDHNRRDHDDHRDDHDKDRGRDNDHDRDNDRRK